MNLKSTKINLKLKLNLKLIKAESEIDKKQVKNVSEIKNLTQFYKNLSEIKNVTEIDEN